MIVQGASQNAPQDLLTRAKNAKTPSEAAIILGQYAGDYYKTELLKQQIATEKAQRAKINASIEPVDGGQAFVTPTGKQYTKEQYEAGQQAGNIKNIINKLKADINNNVGFTSAVGAGFQKAIPWAGDEESPFFAGTEARAFDSKVSQLKNALALPNLSSLKGATSDKDILFLKNIATSLSVGTDEKTFKEELVNVENSLRNIESKYGITISDFAAPTENLSGDRTTDDYFLQSIRALKNSGSTQPIISGKSAGYEF
jgi:hypothetical protein